MPADALPQSVLKAVQQLFPHSRLAKSRGCADSISAFHPPPWLMVICSGHKRRMGRQVAAAHGTAAFMAFGREHAVGEVKGRWECMDA
jgi:hypothetical protein